jgi:hypothetical protein
MNKQIKVSNEMQLKNRILSGGYFLATYHNPVNKSEFTVDLNDDLFAEMVLDSVLMAMPSLDDSLVITPAMGCYFGSKEPSFMLSFLDDISIEDQMKLIDVLIKLFKKLGQESFIYRTKTEKHLMIGSNGKIMMQGSDITFGDFNTDFQGGWTEINGVKFTMDFK